MKRCSICNTQISDFDLFFTCTECDSPYHEICWKEMGGCATYGCKAAAVAEKPPPPTTTARGWGDEKTCPSCASKIRSSVLACVCGARHLHRRGPQVRRPHALRARRCVPTCHTRPCSPRPYSPLLAFLLPCLSLLGADMRAEAAKSKHR